MRVRFLCGFLLVLSAGCGPRSLPHENRSIPELRRMLADAEPRVQAQGALGLSLLGAEARDAVPRLIELLESPDTVVRQQSALALGKIGAPASQAVPVLEKLLGNEDWSVRRQGAIALGEIGEAKARPALEKLRRDPIKLVRQAATDALAKLPGGVKR